MFGSRVGFSAELRILRQGHSYTHCCCSLTFASARLSCSYKRENFVDNVGDTFCKRVDLYKSCVRAASWARPIDFVKPAGPSRAGLSRAKSIYIQGYVQSSRFQTF